MKIGYCAPACYIREVKEAGFDYIELPLCSIAAETDQSFEKILAQLKSENLPCLASNMFLPKSVRVTGNDVNLKTAAGTYQWNGNQPDENRDRRGGSGQENQSPVCKGPG